MRKKRKLVTFDWAMKKILRSKANFKVLEGFLTELLGKDVKILEILESESNKETSYDKSNRADLLVKDSQDRRILIEIQFTREDDYLQRMLYGTAKVLTESISEGHQYKDLARVVSVNIVHFDLGQGDDYVYHGRTEFKGLHDGVSLQLNEPQRKMLRVDLVEEVCPEYFILKVVNFDDVAKNTLDEWIYFLKNGVIEPEFQAKGIKDADKILDVLKLTEAEREAYEAHLHTQRIDMGVAESTILRAEKAEELAAIEAQRANQAEASLQIEAQRAEAEAQRAEAEAQRAEAETQRANQAEALLKQKNEQIFAQLLASGIPAQQAKQILGLNE